MKIYTLEPQDLLFFRDGRPMETSGGHGARWPEPSVIFDALHAALWRAFPEDHRQPWEHWHDFGRSSHRPRNGDTQRFGSLTTAGLFPVWKDERWLFPAPADVTASGDETGWLLSPRPLQGMTNLPASFLKYTVANLGKPTKDTIPPWWSAAAWQDYLAGRKPTRAELFASEDLFLSEWATGIGIDPETQTQDGQRLYSAEYLRLRPGVRAGFSASLRMKQDGDRNHVEECVGRLFAANQTIIVGGQQRACRVEPCPANPAPPLPTGLSDGFNARGEGGEKRWLVKWVLLSPAIWPAIAPNSERGITAHHGGWLPNWICPETGKVLLKAGDTERGTDESREAWRKRVRGLDSIAARLTATAVPKPIPVTGWTERLHLLQDERKRWTATGDEKAHGPRATHLAVPAGAVYYFEADSPEAAAALARALNWHGATSGTEIKNRRSTLMGEKGFGLGVCGTWDFFPRGGGR